MQDNLAYCNHLFDNTTDGYIQVMKLENNQKVKIYNTQYKSLRSIVELEEGADDVYMSSNTYYKPGRSVDAIRQFRALYIDIDLTKYYKAETVYMIYILANEGKIPAPSMVVDSGRGLHLYWKIKNSPYRALHTWQELEDYLYSKLKHLGADIRATDGARVLRLPNTVNSKNDQECKILIINDDIEYTMYDLREKYLNYKPYKVNQLEIHQSKNIDSKVISNKFFNSYSLHLGRLEDVQRICRLRNYDLKGHRNFILHCFAYWKGIYTRDQEELKTQVNDLNNAFKDPLKQSEVNSIMRCIPKAIDKFITYEHSLKDGQAPRVKKGAKDKQGYWYTNKTLIDALDITDQEQQHMKTIIGKEEKYRRNNDKRSIKRRNDDGLTPREQEKQKKITSVKELHEQGLTQIEIAKKLDISRQLVNYYINILKK